MRKRKVDYLSIGIVIYFIIVVSVVAKKPSGQILSEGQIRTEEGTDKRRSSSTARQMTEDNTRKPELGKKTEDEEKKGDPTLSKYYSSKSGSQQGDKSTVVPQKENKPMNIQGEMLAKSLNQEEKEEQLKNLLIDYQDLNKNKQKLQGQKSKQDNSDEENFEEAEENRVYAK